MNPYTRLPRAGLLSGRQDFVIERCRGKRVLHLGCVDSGLLAERFQRGELLHQKLAAVSLELWGVDTDSEGISFLRSAGYENLLTADVCDLDQLGPLQDREFDVVLVPELIEHLLNPGLFLNSLRAFVLARDAELIVSVPNAFRLATLRWLLRGVEYVHPDHNYWFSYHTITNLLRKCGFDINQVRPYTFEPLGILPRRFSPRQGGSGGHASGAAVSAPSVTRMRRLLLYIQSLPARVFASWLCGRTPFFCDGLIIVARAARHEEPGR